jgi:hypothetical protein
MHELSLALKLFFRIVKKELQQNPPDFASIYEKAKSDLGVSYFHEMTEYFINKGYDPLQTLDYIPSHYLSGSNIEEFTIPSHIIEIREGAFSHCKNLKNIIIPPSVIKVKDRAFTFCNSLQTVKIENPEATFEYFAFSPKTTIICKAGSDVQRRAANWGYKTNVY